MDLPEILHFAIDQESKAKDFYELSAAQVEAPEATNLFSSLARMENGHKRMLVNMLETYAEEGKLPQPRKFSPEEEEVMVLKATAKVLREANVEFKRREEVLELDMQAAGEVQFNLIPKALPQLMGLEISSYCFMARRVGGDFYDYLFSPSGELNFTIADVSGKGIAAALLMATVRALWRSRIRDGYVPSKTLELLSQDMTLEFHQSDQFVTMISASYEMESRSLTIANAGHWPPIYYSAMNGAFEPLPPGYLPIGIEASPQFMDMHFKLYPGDVLVFMTDGILEARNTQGDLFDEENVKKTVLSSKNDSAETIRNNIVRAVRKFSGSSETYDDQTLLILKSTQ